MTAKYNIANSDQRIARKRRKIAKTKDDATSTTAQDTTTESHTDTNAKDTSSTAGTKAPKATFTLKCYDPVSGVALKYKTEKAAEVGRLVAAMGRLARYQARLSGDAPSEEGVANDAVGASADVIMQDPVETPADGEKAKPDTATANAAKAGGTIEKKKKGKR